MQLWRDLIRPHPYPQDLDRIAQEFGPQLDECGCGAAVVQHGLLLGGLTIPKSALQAIFRTYPPDGYIDGKRLNDLLHDLGFEPEYLEIKKPSDESRRQFLERLGHEMEQGAFVLACIYGGRHWITLGRWDGNRMRAVDSHDVRPWFPSWKKWALGMYSLTPEALDVWDWQNCVQLVRPGKWHKNYEEWLPGRDRLLRMSGNSLKAPVTMAKCFVEAAHDYLNDDRYGYDQLEFFLSEKTSMAVEVGDPRHQAISVSMPTAEEQEGQVAVVRRLLQSERGQPGPPELIFRVSALRGWQLGGRD